MITDFNNFNIDIDINLPDSLLNEIIDMMSFIVYKGSKRDKQKNYKSIRISKISGNYYNKLYDKECTLQIEMTNKDKIVASFKKNKLIDSTIFIEINDKIVYYLNDDHYNINFLLKKLVLYYIENIENKGWKIK